MASGEAVGLFKGQEGNSEAGHLNIGAGRIVKQDAVYISEAIEDGTFFKNTAFQQAIHHIKKYNTATHFFNFGTLCLKPDLEVGKEYISVFVSFSSIQV
jgi:bisphosphoglycerate-independent phosphoglycerate mutase (AlkP superfamily)